MAWFLHSCHTARLEVVRGDYIARVMAGAPVCTSSHCSVHHRVRKVQKILLTYVEDYVRPNSKDSESLFSEDISVCFVTKGVADTYTLGSNCARRQKFFSCLVGKRKANWIGHILCRNCLLQRVIEGKIKGEREVTGRPGRRRRKLLDGLKERRGVLSFEGGSPRSHYMESSLWKRLWTCRKTDY